MGIGSMKSESDAFKALFANDDFGSHPAFLADLCPAREREAA
jgi:hypothetical protein